MKFLNGLLVLMVFLFSSFAMGWGTAPKFTADGVDAHLLMGVVYGKIDGTPAHRIKDQFFMSAQSAKSWNDAQKICSRLAPRGKWQLPTATDMLLDLVSGASQAAIKLPAEEGKSYPYWVRSDDPKGDSRFAGTSKVAIMSDGHGEEAEVVDIKELVSEYSANKDKISPENRKAAESYVNQFKDGVKVFCVTDSKNIEAKPLSSYKITDADKKDLGEPIEQSSDQKKSNVETAK